MFFLNPNPTSLVSNSLHIMDNYFADVKNFGFRFNLTHVPYFIHYKVKSAYQLFSTIPIYKPAF